MHDETFLDFAKIIVLRDKISKILIDEKASFMTCTTVLTMILAESIESCNNEVVIRDIKAVIIKLIDRDSDKN